MRDADLIVAEDTRVARKLLNAYEIGPKELWSYREQNAGAVTAGILERAREQRVAVVTDAGMPGNIRPGKRSRRGRASKRDCDRRAPRSECAPRCAVLSGFDLRRLLFEGFPPRTSSANAANTLLERCAAERRRFGMNRRNASSPHSPTSKRWLPTRSVFLVREYTKRFEQQLLGTPAEVRNGLASPVRGEIAFAVAPLCECGSGPSAGRWLDAEIDSLLASGASVAEIARNLAKRGAGDRRSLYERASKRKGANTKSVP